MTAPPPLARTLGAIAAATTVCVLPAFLLGSQGVQLQRDLGFDAAVLGAVVAVAWITASLTSAAMGRLAERIGGGTALRIAATASAATQLAVALAARSWALLAVGAMLSGLANALAQPAANLLISRVVPLQRLGLAFAVKQSAIPLATFLGGLAVPLVTLTVGWRWTFAGAAVLAAGAAVAVPVGAERHAVGLARRPPARLPRSRLPTLAVLAAGILLGAAAAGGLAAFLTSGAVAAGMAEGVAGWLLAAGSLAGITVRLTMGARADRTGRNQLPVVATMMASGAVAVAALALQQEWVYVVATPFAFGAGWAWPGLFNLSIVRTHAEAPAAATGITQTGTYLGAALGPLVVGAVVDDGAFGVGWLLCAAALVVGAVIMVVGDRRLAARPSTRGAAVPSTPPASA